MLLVGLIGGVRLFNESLNIASYQSPDKNYELIIKLIPKNPFLVTMPGNGGSSSTSVKAILKDANGKVIGRSYKNCSITKSILYVEWDLENNLVYYSKFHTINLITGEVEC